MIGIYKIENEITHKIYIGQSVDIKRRWNQHIENSKNINSKVYFNELYRDFRYYGIENFSFQVVEEIFSYDKELLNQLEYKWMKYYNSLKAGYNVAALPGQKICLEDIENEEKFYFSNFDSLEKWLHNNNITTGKKLTHFLKQAIKKKEIIYERFLIYYWKE